MSRIYNLSYEEIVEEMQNHFIKEFGEKKIRIIVEKIDTSNKVAKLIEEAEQKKVVPNHIDILTCVNTIPYFILSRGETQVIAALVALNRWDKEVNYFYNLADANDLKLISINIIKKSAPTFTF